MRFAVIDFNCPIIDPMEFDAMVIFPPRVSWPACVSVSAVRFPPNGIIADIFTDAVQIIPIANNVFPSLSLRTGPIIALPYGGAGGSAAMVDAFCGD
jgi:hypothetical protein